MRAARERDAPALVALHERCWQGFVGIADPRWITGRPWEERLSAWRDYCTGRGLPMLVAEQGSQPVGMVAFGAARDADADSEMGEVVALYVDPAAQRHGVGSALLVAAEAQLHAAGYHRAMLWTLRDNHAARAFYAARGWTATTTERYRQAFDACEVRYTRQLRR